MHTGTACFLLDTPSSVFCKAATHARVPHAGRAGPPIPESDLLHRMRAGALSIGAIHLEEAAPTAVAAGVSANPCEVKEQAAKTTQCSSQSMGGCPQQQSSERAISKHMAMSEG